MGNKNSKHNSKPNDFIIKHSQINKEIQKRNIIPSTYDPRRLVFVSLPGLCQTWKKVPSVSLYTALMVLPLKKRWIYKPTEYDNTLQSNLMLLMSQMADPSEITEIIELLKWKETQGLVMWVLDYFDNDDTPIPIGNMRDEQKENSFFVYDPLIAKFWYSFNEKLTSLYDHVTGSHYKPINLDQKWWRNKAKYMSKYDVKPAAILSEFYFLQIKYDVLREMIYQSNPKSLRPVVIYKSISKIECPIIITTKGLATPLSPIKEPLSPLTTQGDDTPYSWSCIQQHNLYDNVDKNNMDNIV